MVVTLNRLAIAFVGLLVIIFSLIKMGIPLFGVLKLMPFVFLFAIGFIVIITAFKKD